MTPQKIVVIIPCYNEADSIKDVISAIPIGLLQKSGYAVDVLVIDNNSSDNTAAVARECGATVIEEKNQGKGYAMMSGFAHVPRDATYVAMIDGDGSYDLGEMPRLLEPLASNFGDAIVGTRLNGRLQNRSMNHLHRTGNWLFTFLARTGYKTNVTDVCSGFYMWKKQVVDDLLRCVESGGFSIEMEMIAKMARMNYECYSVPISYNPRNGHSNLRPVKDGSRILLTWLRYLKWKPVHTSDQIFDSKRSHHKVLSLDLEK